MLLYEKGAMFKAYKDTEKAPGMFGTLVICLPSAHTGGSVKVKHAGQEMIFRSDELGQSYVCWFADVTHEVAEITSGYRWVLTYNLVSKSPSPGGANLIPGVERKLLSSTLREWWDACLVDPREDHPCYYILEHQYTDANLGFDSLKGQDATKVRALKESCEGGNFCCLLANLHREVWGACDAENPWSGYVRHNTNMSGAATGDFHVIDMDEEITTTLKHVVDQNGTWIGEGTPISEDDVVQFKPFRRDPDDEDFMGYTGNEGAQATHTYRDSVVAVMPRPHLSRFLLGQYVEESRYGNWNPQKYTNTPHDIRYLVDYLRRQVETSPTDETCKLMLEKAAQTILDKERSQGLKSSDYCISQAVRCSYTLRNVKLFEDVVSLVRQKLEDEALNDVAAWIRESGLKPFEKALDKCFSSEKALHARYQNLQSFLQYVRGVNDAVDEVKELHLDDWAERLMDDSVENCEDMSIEDAPVLTQMVKSSSRPQKFLDSVAAAAKRNMPDTPPIVALLAHLSRELKSGNIRIPNEIALGVLRDILVQMIPPFSLQPKIYEAPPTEDGWTIYALGHAKPQTRTAPRLGGRALADFCDLVFQLQLEAELNQILDKIKTQSEKADAEMFHSTLLPFLQEFAPIAEKNGIILTEPEGKYRTLYQTIINAYLKRYVRPEPRRPKTWERDAVDCKCEYCTLHLNHFLRNPYERWGHFRFKEERRKHFEYALSSWRTKDYTFETIHGRAPHTLLIGKTENVWRREWDAWAGRSKTGQEKLRQLESSLNLKDVLGDQYNKVTNMEGIRGPRAGNDKTPPSYDTKNTARFVYSEKSAGKLLAHPAYEPPPATPGQSAETASARAGGRGQQQPLQAGTNNIGSSRVSTSSGTKRTAPEAGGSEKRRKA